MYKTHENPSVSQELQVPSVVTHELILEYHSFLIILSDYRNLVLMRMFSKHEQLSDVSSL